MLCILFLGILFLLQTCSAQKNVDTKKNNETFALTFELWRQGKERLFDFLHENVERQATGTGFLSGSKQGKQQFLEKAVNPKNDQQASAIKPKLTDLIVDENIVWLHWKAKAFNKSGATYSNVYAWKLEFSHGKIVNAVAFLNNQGVEQLVKKSSNTMRKTIEETKEYIGMWVTKDGYIRHELLPHNRYDEARGTRKSAYQGAY